MTVQINFEKSEADPDDGVCRLVLENPEKPGGDSLGTYRGYVSGASVKEGDRQATWWTWDNPQDPLEEVTFSPSIITHFGEKQMFHIFVRDGEIEHCGDCQCGCD